MATGGVEHLLNTRYRGQPKAESAEKPTPAPTTVAPAPATTPVTPAPIVKAVRGVGHVEKPPAAVPAAPAATKRAERKAVAAKPLSKPAEKQKVVEKLMADASRSYDDASRAMFGDGGGSVGDKLREGLERTVSVLSGSTTAAAAEVKKVTSQGYPWPKENAPYYRMAYEADRRFGLPTGTLAYFLQHEAPRDRAGVFKPDRRGGSGNEYLGLYQLFQDEAKANGALWAWGQGRAEAKRLGINVPSLATSWTDPQANTNAAAGYALWHLKRLRKQFPQAAKRSDLITLLYLAHQQGYGVLELFLKSGKLAIAGTQSESSVRAFRALA